MRTIHELRRMGYKVRVTHNRMLAGKTLVPQYTVQKGKRNIFLAKGGSTVIDVTRPYETTSISATALCSEHDSFCRRIGIAICLGRIRKLTGWDI